MIELQAYSAGPLSGGQPKQVVVMLHGLGADGQDLIGLSDAFAQSLPDALFVSPDAPFPCDMAPYGRQWFSLQSRAFEDMLKGVQTAAPILGHFLDHVLQATGLDDSKLALLGFSQGTMMSLYAGPRRKGKIAGILGYSGALIWEEDTDSAALQKPPVHLIHGSADDVVPPMAYNAARQILENAKFNVSGGITPGLTHSIDPAGIESGKAFLAKVFS